LVGAKGRVIGIDWDCDLIRAAREENKKSKTANIDLICDSYVNIEKIAGDAGIEKADGILFDFGFSSYHMEQSGRGFSFLRDEPLDMRYNTRDNTLTADEIVNAWPQDRIADMLWRLGGERWARRVARGIAGARARRRIASGRELADIVASSVPRAARGRTHPATRTFQAIRIGVNRELESVERVLPSAWSVLAPGGRLAAISFHSLEDRIVKNFLRERRKDGTASRITPKPVRAGREELSANPRARSALLRGAVKI
jgi:16S rRNA (cytosine1402-N4)-methyltransferase